MIKSSRVLITGGVHRLGGGIALELAEKGVVLGLNYYRTPADEAKAFAERCLQAGAEAAHLLQGDVRSEADAIVERFVKLAGGIDVLINNSGVLPARRKLDNLEPNDLREALELNLVAPFAMVRAAAKQMNSGSAIVNLASLGGVQIWKERIDYNVSKSALITLTKTLARELAEQCITVNAVAPGAIQLEDESEERMGIARERIPMKRYGTVHDIARVVQFLAFDAPYITGQTIIVDGGRSVMS